MHNDKLEMQNAVLVQCSWMNGVVFVLIVVLCVQISSNFLKSLFETDNVDQDIKEEFHNNIFIMLMPLGVEGLQWG